MAPLRTLGIGVRQRGAGLIETMVGILIGLLVVLVVYNLLSVAEGYRRTTVGASDAQITGLLSQFIAGRDAANGGNGITTVSPQNINDLINCINDEAGVADSSLKPIPVLVTSGGGPGLSDSFVSWHSGAPHVIWAVEMRPPNPGAGADITVQSPNGFSSTTGASLPTVATPYWVIAMANNGTGRCHLLQVTGATVPDPGTGNVTLTQGSYPTTIGYSGSAIPPSKVLILGPRGDATRVRYDVSNGQLRTTDCLPACGVANPIAQNVVLMKVQYGVDTTVVADNIMDCWTPADASTCGNWLPATIQSPAFTMDNIQRILAVRIGMVIRSDEPDLKDPALVAGSRPPVVLFNCSTNTDAACQNRVTVPAGASAPNIILDQWRYRTYETVIPLRNAIFPATAP